MTMIGKIAALGRQFTLEPSARLWHVKRCPGEEATHERSVSIDQESPCGCPRAFAITTRGHADSDGFFLWPTLDLYLLVCCVSVIFRQLHVQGFSSAQSGHSGNAKSCRYSRGSSLDAGAASPKC